VLVEMIGLMTSRRPGALIAIPDHVQENTDMVDQKARVIAVGPSAWHDEPAPRAKVGEIVLVTKFAGWMTRGADGRRYRLINDRDIFCAVTEEAVQQEVANG
jgi:co-chaperonin GroES (HSP10)